MANGPGAVQEAVASLIFGPGIDVDPWYDKWHAQDRPAFSIPSNTLVDRDEITDRLGEITQPTLILHGSADAAIPMWRAEQLRDGLGRADRAGGGRRGRSCGQHESPGRGQWGHPGLPAHACSPAQDGGGIGRHRLPPQ